MSIRKLIAVTALVAVPNMAAAQLFRAECTFPTSQILAVEDMQANAFLKRQDIARPTIVFQTTPTLKIVEQPSPFEAFISHMIEDDPQSIKVTWFVSQHAGMADITAMLLLSIDRFSGKAMQIFSAFSSGRDKPPVAHWLRDGQCIIRQRAM